MSKKILKIILGLCIIILLSFYIGAEENLNDSENATAPEIGNIPSEFINLTNSQLDIAHNVTPNESEDKSNITNNIIPDISVNSVQDESTSNLNISENWTNPQEDPISNSGDSSSRSNSEQEVYYIDSSELNVNSTTQNNNTNYSNNDDNFEQEKKEDVCFLHNSLGKKVIEIKDCGGLDIQGIEVQEVERNKLEKEINISSEEHFNKSLTIYVSLPTETKKEEIRIYWKNEENLDITKDEKFLVEYYDEDNNGLIDRVSWIIPHLSEQIFEVVIEFENAIESPEQLLLEVIGPSAQTRNPIHFGVNVNYSGNFSCELKIGSEWYYNISSNQNYSLNLPNDNYTWEAYCFDVTNRSVWNATSGNFVVNESFYSSLLEGKLYFLDLVENKIKNNETININSTSPSNFIIKLIREGQVIYTKNSSNNTTIVMNESILNSSGTYNLKVEFNEPSPKVMILTNFSVASANLVFNTTQIKEGQSVKISVNLNSPVKKISPIILDYGDGSSPYYSITETNQFIQDFQKIYNKDGKYSVNLSVAISGLGTFTIQRNGINVTDVPSSTQTDKESPSITLSEPEDEKVIHDSIVNFSYKANDNVKIQNCTFKLYGNCASMNYCSTNDANLIFPTSTQQKTIANNYSVQNNKKVEIDLKDFESGIYEWLVECYDNSSNYDWEIRFFEISENKTSTESSIDYEQEEEINQLKEEIDNFLEESFTLEEKEVLEDLNILNDTKYYKKRLLDMQGFFEENYKYVSSESLREKKTEEYLEELRNIKNQIPQEITIKDNYEYIKNSVDADFESIVKDYFESTNTNIGKSSIKKLAKINRELQNEISVSAKVKNIEIEYKNRTQQITLIKKEVKLEDESYNQILEIIPKEVIESSDKINFITENKIIKKDPLFEVNYEDLEKKEIIYYINQQVDLKDFEKTETLLFEDDLNKLEASVTGFFVVDFASGGIALYLILAFILLIILLFMGFFVFKKFRMISWKREPNVVRVMYLIEEIEKLLKQKEIERAREKYYKIKEIYPVLPSKTKAYFYKKINEMMVRIDRKDIFNLVKEYQEAKRKWNKEDYIRLYEDIKKIYERLPEKDRKRVYDIINGY